jgi:hypothetical protein
MATLGPSTAAFPDELQWLYGDLFLRRIEFEGNHREVMWSQMIRKLYGQPNPAITGPAGSATTETLL